MIYKTYPGVILTSICNHNYLISPDITIEVNDTTVFYWNCLVKGMKIEDLKKEVINEYEIDNDALLDKEIELFLNTLLEKKLIIGLETQII